MEKWHSSSTINSKNYVCGHCGSDITSNIGYHMYESSSGSSRDIEKGYIYICHQCNKPTYFDDIEQVPGAVFGKKFDKKIFTDELIFELYNEARRCMEINAFTSVGMCCRKILMHIAVECGAKENQNFTYYVDYLNDGGYITVNCKKWVDIIRSKGNEANHKIIILDEKDAKQLIIFVQNIITMIYEMPYQADLYTNGGIDE